MTARGITRWPSAAVAAVLALALAAEIVGAVWARGRLWGAHAWGYLPPLQVLLGLALALAPALAMPRFRGRVAVPRGGVAVGFVAVFVAACTVWRAGHLLLGDGLPLVASPTGGIALHPLEPLAMMLQSGFRAVFSSAAGSGQPHDWRLAWASAAALSVGCGALFAWTALSMARRLAATLGAGSGSLAPLAAGVLVAQGYAQVFCGYVENYAVVAVAFAGYLVAGWDAVEGRRPLAVPGVLLVLALGLHLSAALLVPSFAVAAVMGLASAARRRETLIAIAVTGAAFAALAALLALVRPGHALASILAGIVGGLVADALPPGGGLFTTAHAWAFVNEALLLGPVGLFVFVTAVVAVAGGGGRTPRDAFFAAAGSGALAAAALAGDSNLGWARNWDLLAPAGVVLTFSALALLMPHLSTTRARRALLVGLTASLLHTLPWVMVNASAPAGLARFSAIDLGAGRTESTVGYWLALEGDERGAERWWLRAIEREPRNVRALLFLGRLYAGQRRWDEAAGMYRRAMDLRPDIPETRAGLERVERERAGAAGP